MAIPSRSLATDNDRSFFKRELESFLPDRLFDAHAHVFGEWPTNQRVKGLPQQVGYLDYQTFIQDIHGQRHTSALFLPNFDAIRKDQIPKYNGWVSQQVSQA